MVAGAVGRVDLDLQREEVPSQPRDPVAVGNRQQGSHPGLSLLQRDLPRTRRARLALACRPRITRVMAYSETGVRACPPPVSIAPGPTARAPLRSEDRPCGWRPGTTSSRGSASIRSRT